MIRIYVYNKSSGVFKYEDSGLAEFVISDISSDCDFTLQPPPNYSEQWRWDGLAWIKDDSI